MGTGGNVGVGEGVGKTGSVWVGDSKTGNVLVDNTETGDDTKVAGGGGVVSRRHPANNETKTIPIIKNPVPLKVPTPNRTD